MTLGVLKTGYLWLLSLVDISSPDKSGYRTSAVPLLHLSNKRVSPVISHTVEGVKLLELLDTEVDHALVSALSARPTEATLEPSSL